MGINDNEKNWNHIFFFLDWQYKPGDFMKYWTRTDTPDMQQGKLISNALRNIEHQAQMQ